MSQPDGFTDIPAGKVAAIVTHLEMTARPVPRATRDLGDLALVHVTRPDLHAYRDLFLRVGGTGWLWCSRLKMQDVELADILHDPEVQVHELRQQGRAVGLLELDFREEGACELAFLGLEAGLTGQGLGPALVGRAIEMAWSRPLRRMHVHTCTFDHPGALGVYRRAGFRPVRQQVEVFDDPRLTGLLPRDAAPHIPVIALSD
ncbi:GNAT family N-acetyltransferase [Dinoroseobacter sp. S375]|uniref:GNAT family N-acetyltransferase n=1 Tax=Dinoroseobacter sp. S375 TaxID=3415136 RepID=UPI003C7B937E